MSKGGARPASRGHRVAEEGHGHQSADPQYRQFLNKHLHLLGEATRGLGDTEGVAEVERELAKLRDSDPAMVAFDEWLAAVLTGKAPKDNA